MKSAFPLALIVGLAGCSNEGTGRPVLGADREHALVFIDFPEDENTGELRILSVDLEDGRVNHTVYTDPGSEPDAYWTQWASDEDMESGRSVTTAGLVGQYAADSEPPGSGKPIHLYSLVMPGGDDLQLRLVENGDYSDATQEFTAFFIGLWHKYPEP